MDKTWVKLCLKACVRVVMIDGKYWHG